MGKKLRARGSAEFPPGLVWGATFYDRYQVEVQRLDRDSAELVMFDHHDDELLREKVSLAYGAAFGPDVADVDGWIRRCEAAIEEERRPKRSIKEMILAIPKSSGPEEDALFESALRRESEPRPDPFEDDEG